MRKDKLVIVVILLIAIGATAIAWWFRWRNSNQALAFWGGDAAILIRHAPRAALLELQGPTESVAPTDSDRLIVDESTYEIILRRDISEAPGMLNARQALIENGNFIWNQDLDPATTKWEFAFVFSRGEDRAVVLVDLTKARVALLGKEGQLDASPIKGGLKTIIEEQL